MYIYDSVKKDKVKFVSIQKNKVALYVCGPTVYDNAHLGHAKSALTFDLLYRTLTKEGHDVTYARNITDIDDKIIKKSLSENKNILELTKFYTNSFDVDMDKLNVIKPTITPKATENISVMIELIEKLIDSNHAYLTSDGDVYFDITKDKKYLSISNNNSDNKLNRIQSSDLKLNEEDFALWKNISDGTISYDSPFGKGRPGWHLECSAMIEKYLAIKDSEYSIDIHGGGSDLLFPHHENEAAQTRCSTNNELAKYWMHNGFIKIDNEIMSKSKGNGFFLKEAFKENDPELIRFYLISSHYKTDVNFTEKSLKMSKVRLDKLYRLKSRVFSTIKKRKDMEFENILLQSLSDDLNMSLALSHIDKMINDVNDQLDKNKNDKVVKEQTVSNIKYINELIGIGYQNPYDYFKHGLNKEFINNIDKMIMERTTAKDKKDYKLSDEIRNNIEKLNVTLMDTPNGTVWEVKN